MSEILIRQDAIFAIHKRNTESGEEFTIYYKVSDIFLPDEFPPNTYGVFGPDEQVGFVTLSMAVEKDDPPATSGFPFPINAWNPEEQTIAHTETNPTDGLELWYELIDESQVPIGLEFKPGRLSH